VKVLEEPGQAGKGPGFYFVGVRGAPSVEGGEGVDLSGRGMYLNLYGHSKRWFYGASSSHIS